jgi:site-specific recombinase XerD
MSTQGEIRRRLPQLAEDWLAWQSAVRHATPATIVSYRSSVRGLLRFTLERFGTTDIRVITRQQLLEYFVDLEARGLSPFTRVGRLTALRSWMRFLKASGEITQDVTLLLGRPRTPKLLPRYLTLREVDRLLDATKGPDLADVRLHAILQILYATGIRVTELSTVRIPDVDLARGQVLVFGKGRVERYCNLHPEAKRAIADWIVRRRGWFIAKDWTDRDDGALIINFRDGTRLRREGIEDIVAKLGRAVGIERKVHPHLFRHTVATHMRARGARIEDIRDMLGHASISTTQIYAHVTPELREELYLATHPKGGTAGLRRAAEA